MHSGAAFNLASDISLKKDFFEKSDLSALYKEVRTKVFDGAIEPFFFFKSLRSFLLEWIDVT